MHRWEGTSSEAQLDVEVCLAEIASKTVLHQRRYVIDWKPAVVEAAVLRDALARLSPAERFLAWSVGAGAVGRSAPSGFLPLRVVVAGLSGAPAAHPNNPRVSLGTPADAPHLRGASRPRPERGKLLTCVA